MNKKNNYTSKVSVIIPFYKNKLWLHEALESVHNQTFQDFEVIIINDGSDEDISDIENKYAEYNFYKIENSGPGKARNYGISLSKGEYIAFLDSDDLWVKDKLVVQIEYMERTGYIWSHSNYIRFSDSSGDSKNINCRFEGNIIPQMFTSSPIATPCVMIRNDVLIKNLDFRFAENERVGEDSHFWFKLAEHYYLGFIDLYLTKVRIRGSNASVQSYIQLKSKASSYEFIKTRGKYYNNKIYYNLIKFGHWLAKIGYKFICFLDNNFNMKPRVREFLSKIFYAFPYLYLKLFSYLKITRYNLKK